ncbi:nicotinate-nucleotide adenylyltransferase [Bacillus weihaiensis]|uniref:Probable nicotinate-nucleotide adenylyltransferase n=1 Tax=Bacillus weihaiensis TaxID=1547283 RepID=A0A1L3MPQ2_9BACI|nr:nicotinate-nucleotide adenylyltransferase [Bacillus weihaiensis]APH04309.1 nicotinic acid mononucleotide adenylyltransferase [Bacillus weihaiensis]
MKKIGILGGTFDPPHLGHLFIANEVLHKMQLSEIWFIPNEVPPHKQADNFTDSRHRLEMLKLAVKDCSAFHVSTIELERDGASYTYDTLQLLHEEFPEHSFYFIIGADMIEYLSKWHKIDELVNMITFIGVNRRGYETKSPYPVTTIDIPLFEVSSTMLRERLSKNETTAYLLQEEVKRYIEENHLYGT